MAAHITTLSPRLLDSPPIEVTCRQVVRFPDALYLDPEPAMPFGRSHLRGRDVAGLASVPRNVRQSRPHLTVAQSADDGVYRALEPNGALGCR
jgi:2'-5' RNA ligase superfamily